MNISGDSPPHFFRNFKFFLSGELAQLGQWGARPDARAWARSLGGERALTKGARNYALFSPFRLFLESPTPGSRRGVYMAVCGEWARGGACNQAAEGTTTQPSCLAPTPPHAPRPPRTLKISRGSPDESVR